MGNPTLARPARFGPAGSRYRFTVAEFHRLGEAGVLDEDDRVELIEGELINMAPIGSRHAGVVVLLNNLFAAAARGRYLVSSQNPIQIAEHSEPQPDLTLLKPRADTYREALPQPPDILLVIEVADSSLDYDRDVKIPLYGRSGIPEAWLVDLQRKVVTVYREPGAEGYAGAREFAEGTLTPACLPDVGTSVAELVG